MRTLQILGTLSLVVLAVSASTWAQSLATRKMRADQEAALGGQVALTNTKCGTSLTARIDWNTFDEAEVLTKRVMSWCQAALDAVEDICGDALGKEALTSKVTSITCAGAATPAATLKEGELTFSFSLTPNQNKLLVRTYLEKNL